MAISNGARLLVTPKRVATIHPPQIDTVNRAAIVPHMTEGSAAEVDPAAGSVTDGHARLFQVRLGFANSVVAEMKD